MNSILVIDDSADFIEATKVFLKRHGYQVEATMDGAEGLRLAKENRPDLVMLDLLMEPMDGFAICRALRNSTDQELSRTPVVMLTNADSLTNNVKALNDAEVDDFLSKSVDHDILLAKIQRLMRKTVVPGPYWKRSGGAILGLTCIHKQPIHLSTSRAVEFLGITTEELDADPKIWGMKAGAINTARDWRVLAKECGRELWKKIFIQHGAVNGRYQNMLGQLKNEERQLRLRFPGSREFLRVPLEFMVRDEDYVVLSHPFSRSVMDISRKTNPLSAELLDRIWAERRPLRILAIASNVSGVGLPRIPGVDAEVKHLAELMPAWFGPEGTRKLSVDVRVLTTDMATYSAVERELSKSQYDIIHYAGHGIRNDNEPEESCFPFWRSANHAEGYAVLKPLQLAHLLMQSRPSFVYLSACEGAHVESGERLIDREYLGLIDAVLKAGVPSVLGYRWPVSDQGAELLAREFYASLGRQGELDVALLDARKALAGQDANEPTWLSPLLVIQG